MDLFHRVTRERECQAPSPACIFIGAWAFERLEPRLSLGVVACAPEAHARGLHLLQENLSPAQRDQYDRRGYFDVIGGETRRRYRIKPGFQMNVEQLDKKGRPVRRLCFAPEGMLAVGDVMLAQKLALELFELQALEVANSFSHSLFGPMP
jgi:hypothetical protein